MLQKLDPETAAKPPKKSAAKNHLSVDNRDLANSPQLRRVVFKIALRADALLNPQTPYQLIIGAEKNSPCNTGQHFKPWVTIAGDANNPLKSHSTWLNRLTEKVEQSDSEPKLALLAVPTPALVERATVAWLTPREHEMLHYRHQGFTAKETATLVGLSRHTGWIKPPNSRKTDRASPRQARSRKIITQTIKALFNTYRLIENYLSKHPPAVANGYWK